VDDIGVKTFSGACWFGTSGGRLEAALPTSLRGAVRPTHLSEAPDAGHTDFQAFGAKEFPFQLQVPAVAAEAPAGRDDPVTGHSRVVTVAHRGADGAGRPRRSGQGCDVSIRGDTPHGNAPDRREHAPPESVTGQR
jgi:hypothetical protein